VAGKKIGKAVRRNRARRLIREAVRLRLPLIKEGWDLVWIARPAIAHAMYSDVAKDIDSLLRRSQLLVEPMGQAGPAERVQQHRHDLRKEDDPTAGAVQSRITEQEPAGHLHVQPD
jgi:ribonuclease P protein component